MAIILACDNCGKQSPDEHGHRIADEWLTITALTQRQHFSGNKTGLKYVFCEDCLPEVVSGILADELGVTPKENVR